MYSLSKVATTAPDPSVNSLALKAILPSESNTEITGGSSLFSLLGRNPSTKRSLSPSMKSGWTETAAGNSVLS